MNEIERIEKAVQSPEYKTLGAMAGAALAGALMAQTPAARKEATRQYYELLAKQAEVVKARTQP